MPGQRAAVVERARTLGSHWEAGIPGRAPKRHCPLQPADHMALARRSIVGQHAPTHSCLALRAAAVAQVTSASSSSCNDHIGARAAGATPEQPSGIATGILAATNVDDKQKFGQPSPHSEHGDDASGDSGDVILTSFTLVELTLGIPDVSTVRAWPPWSGKT